LVQISFGWWNRGRLVASLNGLEIEIAITGINMLSVVTSCIHAVNHITFIVIELKSNNIDFNISINLYKEIKKQLNI
jgi:hypothetical protein